MYGCLICAQQRAPVEKSTNNNREYRMTGHWIWIKTTRGFDYFNCNISVGLVSSETPHTWRIRVDFPRRLSRRFLWILQCTHIPAQPLKPGKRLEHKPTRKGFVCELIDVHWLIYHDFYLKCISNNDRFHSTLRRVEYTHKINKEYSQSGVQSGRLWQSYCWCVHRYSGVEWHLDDNNEKGQYKWSWSECVQKYVRIYLYDV